MEFRKRHDTTDTTDLYPRRLVTDLLSSVHTGDYSRLVWTMLYVPQIRWFSSDIARSMNLLTYEYSLSTVAEIGDYIVSIVDRAFGLISRDTTIARKTVCTPVIP